MNDVIASNQAKIAELCERYGVRKLELFGSANRETFDPATSDFDFVVDFADRSPGYAQRYLAFADALEELVGRPIDLVTERSIRNPYLRASIDASKVTVYESSRQAAA